MNICNYCSSIIETYIILVSPEQVDWARAIGRNFNVISTLCIHGKKFHKHTNMYVYLFMYCSGRLFSM